MTEPSLQSAVEEFMQSPENQCFACGPGNPYGLQLHFHREDGVTWAEFVPARWHEGWQGVVHGGIVTTLLDEAMAYTLFFDGYQALTARLQVRFRSAVRRDDHLRVEARILNERRNLVDI